MLEHGWHRSAAFAVLFVMSLAVAGMAAEMRPPERTPAPPPAPPRAPTSARTPVPAPARTSPAIRPNAGGPSATTPVVGTLAPASASGYGERPTTIVVTPVIRSVAPGAVLDDRPRMTPVASPRDATPDLSITWEGEWRYRSESHMQFDYRVPGTFGRPVSQSLGARGDFAVMRTRLGAMLEIRSWVRGFLRLQDARTMGAEGSPPGSLGNLHLYSAWLDFDSLARQPLQLRVGRQGLGYPEGRILDGSEWSNSGRGFDGARLRWTPGHARFDGFATWMHEGGLTGHDRLLSGLDALWRSGSGFEAEAYHFVRSFGYAAWRSELGNWGGIHDATTGLRARAVRGALELALEGAVQRGQRAGDPVKAGFGAGRLTADLQSAWKTRVFAGHARSSGDPDPTDAVFQRFDRVDWGGHGLRGTPGITGESNLSDWCGGLTAQPAPGWTVRSEYHLLSLAQARDVWVDDAGTTLRRDLSGAAGTAVGREFSAAVRWDSRARPSVLVGGSWFWRGEFVRKTGGGGDAGWGFAQLSLGF
jgi:hypothetical protein